MPIPLDNENQGLENQLNALRTDINAVRTVLAGILSATDTWDPGEIADGDEAVKEVTVEGAALGDFVLVSSSIDVADLALVAQVTAADTVTVQLLNNTGGAINLGEISLAIRVLPADSFAAPAALTTVAGT